MSYARYDGTCRMQAMMEHVECKLRWNLTNPSHDGTCRILATMEHVECMPRWNMSDASYDGDECTERHSNDI